MWAWELRQSCTCGFIIQTDYHNYSYVIYLRWTYRVEHLGQSSYQAHLTKNAYDIFIPGFHCKLCTAKYTYTWDSCMSIQKLTLTTFVAVCKDLALTIRRDRHKFAFGMILIVCHGIKYGKRNTYIFPNYQVGAASMLCLKSGWKF